MTSAEVAAGLGISSATVQRHAREGRIPFSTTPGGHRRFDLEEVRTALDPGNSDPGAVKQRATAVILTALGVEFAAVMAHLPETKSRRVEGGTRYEIGEFMGENLDWTIAATEIGPGNHSAAAETAHAIDTFRPNIVFFVGVAGSLKSDLTHGSVVVANRVYRYHSGKADDDFFARTMTLPTWHGLEQLVLSVRRTEWSRSPPQPAVELKPIAAGEQVIASKKSDTFKLIHVHCNDAVAVDMESAGMYEAARRAEGVAALAVRGISDMLDDKTTESDRDWQPVASSNAAAFTFALLKFAHPGDLNIVEPSNQYSSEWAELISRVPPPAATVLEGSKDRGGPTLQMLRVMARNQSVTADAAQSLLTGIQGSEPGAINLTAAVGEYSASHRLNVVAARAFEMVANLESSEGKSRWFARAALAAGASEDIISAQRLLAEARRLASHQRDSDFADIIDGAIREDAGDIERAATALGSGDGLVDLFHVKSLDVLGRSDEALDLALTILADHPNRALTGGLALEAARLLLVRVEKGGRGLNTTQDIEHARNLALEVRDLRRQWNGPSEDAAIVAAAAAGRGAISGALFVWQLYRRMVMRYRVKLTVTNSKSWLQMLLWLAAISSKRLAWLLQYVTESSGC